MPSQTDMHFIATIGVLTLIVATLAFPKIASKNHLAGKRNRPTGLFAAFATGFASMFIITAPITINTLMNAPASLTNANIIAINTALPVGWGLMMVAFVTAANPTPVPAKSHIQKRK